MIGYDLIMFRRAMVIDVSTLADMVADNSTAALTFHDHGSGTGMFYDPCAHSLTSPRLACTARMVESSLPISATAT